MTLELSEAIAKIGGGVVVDHDVAITVGNEWTDVAEFEITTASHIGVTITIDNPVAGIWAAPAPTVTVTPADGRSIVRGVNYVRSTCSTTEGDSVLPWGTAGQLEPGKYVVRAHSQKSGRDVELTHVTVTAVPA